MVFDPLVILLCNRKNRSMLVAVWEREESIRTNKFSGSKAVCNKRHISLAGTRNAVVVKGTDTICCHQAVLRSEPHRDRSLHLSCSHRSFPSRTYWAGRMVRRAEYHFHSCFHSLRKDNKPHSLHRSPNQSRRCPLFRTEPAELKNEQNPSLCCNRFFWDRNRLLHGKKTSARTYSPFSLS